MVIQYDKIFDNCITIAPYATNGTTSTDTTTYDTQSVTQNNETSQNITEPTKNNQLNELLRKVPPQKGLIMLESRQNNPLLLLMCSNMRKTAQKQLIPNEKNQPKYHTNLAILTEKLWFLQCYSHFETRLKYLISVRKCFPQTYRELLKHPDIWFLYIDTKQQYPVLRISNQHYHGINTPELCWGPFLRKATADNLLKQILSVFQLCRQPAALARAPRAKPCIYAQLNRCLPVCNGTVSVQRYRQAVNRAIDFMHNFRGERIFNKPNIINTTNNNVNMSVPAEQMQFDGETQVLFDLMNAETCKWVMPWDKFRFLVLMPGPTRITTTPNKKGKKRCKIQLITPFIIMPGQMQQMEPFATEHIDKASNDLLNHFFLMNMQRDNILQRNTLRDNIYTNEQADNFARFDYELGAWVIQTMYQNKDKKGSYIRISEDVSSNYIADKIREHLARQGNSLII